MIRRTTDKERVRRALKVGPGTAEEVALALNMKTRVVNVYITRMCRGGIVRPFGVLEQQGSGRGPKKTIWELVDGD